MAIYEMCLTFLLFGFISSINAQTLTQIKVVSVPDAPFLMKGSNGQFSGYVPDLLDKLQYNFTIYNPADGMYGYQAPNGTWFGMIGELVNGEADMAGLFTVTSRRAKVVDLSFPVMSVGLSILMKKPARREATLQENLSQLLYPFEVSVWLMSFVALFVTGTVLYIMMHFNPYEWRRMARDHEATHREAESFTCLNSFFFVASTLMWQGYVRAPRSVGSRVLVIAWWIFTVIFIVSYTANLTNFFRVGLDSNPYNYQISSTRDLANSDVRVGILPAGATYKFLKESKLPEYQLIFQKAIDDRMFGNLISIEERVEYLRSRPQGDFALILESPTARYLANQEPCDLYTIYEGFPFKHYAFGFQQNSSLTEDISSALMRLSETGEIHDLEKKWFKSKCPDAVLTTNADKKIEIKEFQPLDLATFSTALVIVLAGIVLGGIICVIEICIYTTAEMNDEESEAANESGTKQKLLKIEGKKGGATQV